MNVDKIEDDIRLFKADFKQHPHEFLTSKWVLEKIPYIFNNDSEAYIKTKLKLASMIHVDSCSIIFVGSASTGFSLSPMKNFRKFNALRRIRQIFTAFLRILFSSFTAIPFLFAGDKCSSTQN